MPAQLGFHRCPAPRCALNPTARVPLPPKHAHIPHAPLPQDDELSAKPPLLPHFAGAATPPPLLSAPHLPDVRQAAADHFAAVLGAVGQGAWPQLLPAFQSLAACPELSVLTALVEAFPRMAAVLVCAAGWRWCWRCWWLAGSPHPRHCISMLCLTHYVPQRCIPLPQGPEVTTSDLIPHLELMLDANLEELAPVVAPLLGELVGALPPTHRAHMLLVLPVLGVQPGERHAQRGCTCGMPPAQALL